MSAAMMLKRFSQSPGKLYAGKKHDGRDNQHNGKIPHISWLPPEEKESTRFRCIRRKVISLPVYPDLLPVRGSIRWCASWGQKKCRRTLVRRHGKTKTYLEAAAITSVTSAVETATAVATETALAVVAAFFGFIDGDGATVEFGTVQA